MIPDTFPNTIQVLQDITPLNEFLGIQKARLREKEELVAGYLDEINVSLDALPRQKQQLDMAKSQIEVYVATAAYKRAEKNADVGNTQHEELKSEF